MTTPTLRIDRKRLISTLLVICGSIELLLFTLDYHLNYSIHARSPSVIRRLFATSSEDGLAGWFAIIQTAMIAATLWLLVVLIRRTGTRLQAAGWTAIAAFFTYLAFDDGAHIHERIGTFYGQVFAASTDGLAAWTLDMFPSYRWQIVFMPLFATMGLFIFGFMMHQLRGWKPKVVVLIALSMLAGAVGLDFFEGLSEEHELNPYTAMVNSFELDYWSARTFGRGPYETLLHFSKSIEETMEMFAMTLLWCVFLGHLTWLARDLRIQFVSPGRAKPVTAEPVAEIGPVTIPVASA